MIERLIRAVVRRRRLVLLLVLALTALAAAGLTRLRFYNRMVDWIPKSDPQLALYSELSERFSLNEMVLVLIKPTEGVFAPESLVRIKRLTEALQERSEIFNVASLANASDIRKTGDGIEVANLLDRVPEDAASAAALKSYVLSKEGFRNRVVSGDGEWAAVSVFVQGKLDVIHAVDSVVIPAVEREFKGRAEILYTGTPADGHFINGFTRRDLIVLLPIMIAAILVILYFNLGSWRDVLSPILIVLVACVWLFGLIGWLGRPLTLITPAAPVLLMALGSAYGIYVVNKIQHDRRESPGRPDGLVASVAVVVVPIFFAAVTDIVGFLSFRSVPLSLVADFGLFAAIGLLFSLILAVTLIPALAAILGTREEKVRVRKREGRLLEWGSRLIIRRPRLILTVYVLVFILGALGILLLKREVGFAGFYAKGSPPRAAMELANAELDGAYPLSLDLQAEEVRSPEALRILRRGENFLMSLDRTGLPYSIADLVQELNDRMNDRFALPDERRSVENLWIFVEGRSELNQLLASDQKEAVAIGRVSDPTTDFNSAVNEKMKAFFAGGGGRGFVRFDLAELSAAEAGAVRSAERRALAEEIVWLARRYFRIALASEAAAARLGEGWGRPIPAAETGGARAEAARAYLESPSFPFDTTAAERERVLSDLRALPADAAPGTEAVGSVLNARLPAAARDAATARDAAEALVFKFREVDAGLRVRALRDALDPLLPGRDENFEKRARSMLYDLTDDLAVLPASAGAPAGGAPVAVRRFEHTGYPVILSLLSEMLFRSQIQSILLAFVLTLAMMIVMRRSAALGLISIVPIAFTSVVMYGVLGYLKIPLDFATMMIGSVSIGVGIDYTIHFLYVVTDEVRSGVSLEEAVRRAFRERGRAIVSNTAAVMAGFAVLLFSSFLLLRSFGMAMVLSMFLCFISALTILPVLLLLVRPKILERLSRKGVRHDA